MKKILQCAILNIIIAVLAVAAYSPGIMNLRPDAESIFSAGMSIILGVVLVGAFFYGNYRILKEPELERVNVSMEDLTADEKIHTVLKFYSTGKFFGSYAKEALSQKERLDKTIGRAEGILESRFDSGSMSHSRYAAIVENARQAAQENLVGMANRLQIFDEGDYERLQHYKEDDIPDDIQEEQIALYQKNLELIKSVLELNEKLIYKLDSMTMALSLPSNDSQNETELLEEIERLTKEAEFYR